MREDIDEIYKQLREECNSQILVDRLVRAVRQEKAREHIKALEAKADPRIEKLSEYLEYEMASLLQSALDDGTLGSNKLTVDNRQTLKLIAKGAAVGFKGLNVAFAQ